MLETESLCLPKNFRLTAFFNHKKKPELLVAVSIKPDVSEARVRFNYQLFCHFLFNQFIFSGFTDFWPFRNITIRFIKDLFLLQHCCMQRQHQDVRQLFTLLYYLPYNFLCLVNQNNLWKWTRMPDQQDTEKDTEIHRFLSIRILLPASMRSWSPWWCVCSVLGPTQFPKHH